jgi:hypothetical protein
LALSVPLSRFTSQVGGGSAFFVRPALAVFLPPLNRAYREYQAPHYSQQTQNEIQTAVDQAIKKVIAEKGFHPQPVIRNIYFPFGSILLVAGLWLVARREPHRPNTALEPTPTAP